jgi:DNA-binding CsgD family transcriptional regulator
VVVLHNQFSTGEAAFAVDRRGVVVSWNRGAEKIFGIERRNAIGTECWDLLKGKDLFGNRYCSRQCPLRDMMTRGEELHSLRLWLVTEPAGFRSFSVHNLQVFEERGDKLLLHICEPVLDGDQASPIREGFPGYPPLEENVSLTRREQEVLELLAEGLSTKKIASKLFISKATVRNHIQHLMQKLNAHNRVEAIAVAHRQNIL